MQLIDTPSALRTVCKKLNESVTFYIDTEFESNRAGKTLSLVQVIADTDVYVVDALRLPDLSELATPFVRDGSLWVFHAGLQDVELLAERFGIDQPPRLFDTQIAWGLLSPEGSVSLAYLQYRLLGHRSMKTHQADDWMRRPLPRAQLTYAANDVIHLPELHAELNRRADALDRKRAIEEATRELLVPDQDLPSEVSLRSFRNAWQLDPPNQAALRFMIDWYNRLDIREQRFAPSPKTFLSIASRLPRSARDLGRIKGLPARWCHSHGARFTKELIDAVERAQSGDFEEIEPPPYATFEEIRLEGWLQYMRAEVSARAQVAPEIAFNQRVLRRIRDVVASSRDRAEGVQALSGWRARVLGEQYLAFCKRHG